jgi:hypothetical protein
LECGNTLPLSHWETCLPSATACGGFTIKEIFNLTKIDRWFMVQTKEIVDFEEELASVVA